jgi:hypothetical protein
MTKILTEGSKANPIFIDEDDNKASDVTMADAAKETPAILSSTINVAGEMTEFNPLTLLASCSLFSIRRPDVPSLENATNIFMATIDHFIAEMKTQIDKEFIADIALEMGIAFADQRMRILADKKQDGSLVSSKQSGINQMMLIAATQSFFEVAKVFGSKVASKNLSGLREDFNGLELGNSFRNDHDQAYCIEELKAFGPPAFLRKLLENNIHEISAIFPEPVASQIVTYLLFKLSMIILDGNMSLPEIFNFKKVGKKFYQNAKFLMPVEVGKWDAEHQKTLETYHPYVERPKLYSVSLR